jgi:prolyl-tRNA synthetase
MRYSKSFIPSLREVPKEATNPSHVLLLRGGYIRMVGAGVYEMLPLGMRVLHKVGDIVRAEMDRAGAQEVLMPALLPSEYFQESGRWDTFGDALFRLRDRRGQDYNLGPTHEEIFTDLVRRDVKSYRQLPLNLYQIQTKFRDEPRPRAGLLRGREFVMKDAYSFDVSEEAAVESYERMRDAYHRVFSRLGLTYRMVAADSGAMGGSTSAEFQVLTQTGEDRLVVCTACDYAANTEVAETKSPEAAPTGGTRAAIEKIRTPGKKGIDDVVAFLGGDVTPARMLKSLLYVAGDEVVMIVVRGDHEVNEIRAARHLGVDAIELASDADVFKATGAPVGFAGPVGFRGRVVIDPSAAAVEDAITGANEKDHHLRNVAFGRDFQAEVAPVRLAAAGDACPKCGAPLEAFRGIEGGHIFILGTHYSQKMGATFLDEQGQTKPIVMGCYGIGVSRLMATSVEQNHDDDGIRWPMPIAPYHAIVTPIGKDGAVFEAAERLYTALGELGVEVLLDDRDERPGVKFKDADLLGIPLRVTIGARGLADGVVELKLRTAPETEKVKLEEAAEAVKARVLALGGRLRGPA